MDASWVRAAAVTPAQEADTTWTEEVTERIRRPRRRDETPLLPERYALLELLGRGGMGEVYRVYDRTLGRALALKVVRKDLLDNPVVLSRFVEEAQVAAQLQHPGIVPIHDLGHLPDGRLFFTMKEVNGRTLASVAVEVHRQSRAEGCWALTPDGWGLNRLVDAFRKVCEAMAYAHARQVVHRDLKPSNVMIGEYGEVLVLDWGLVKVLERNDDTVEPEVRTYRSGDDSLTSRFGSVAGTPAYMAPEQRTGDSTQVGPWTDVYSLAVMLSDLLHGTPDAGPLELPVPHALQTLVERGRQHEPSKRFPEAGALAAEVAAWLEGARRSEEARALVASANALKPRIAELHAAAAERREEAEAQLLAVDPRASIDDKRAAWRLQDEAADLEREEALLQVEANQFLRAALSQVPDLSEANEALSDYYRQRHSTAEDRRDRAAAAQYEALLRAHDTGKHAAWLRGMGRVTLHTEPTRATVRIWRYVERDRRLVPTAMGRPMTTPLVDVELPVGSYRFDVTAPGRVTVRVPVLVEREGVWHGIAPGESQSRPIALPVARDLGPDDVLVPGGWFWSGGDAEAIGALARRRLWVDAFVVRRFPVTHGEYVQFLDALVAAGREEDAVRCAPCQPADGDRSRGPLVYLRRADGRFALPPGLEPRHPVTLVDWFSAEAYATWLAAKTQQPWRLLRDDEWEKAARGVDGRSFPWGEHLDPTFCCFMTSHAATPALPRVDEWPLDESPYGVRGLGGGVRDWVSSAYTRFGAPVVDGRRVEPAALPDATRVKRGGCWSHHERLVRSATRWWEHPDARWYETGFRLGRSA